MHDTEQHTKNTGYKTYVMHGVMAVIVLLMVITAYFLRASVYAALTQAKFIPLPETFTELYISDHSHLSSTARANQPIQFSFTIHNHENKTMQYPYTVILSADGKEYDIDAKTITIPNGAFQTIQEQFQIVNPPAISEVVITLVNKQQSVDFYLSKAL